MDIDSFVESLWLRALDLTSKDFKSEKAYLTGKANYEKLARQALQSYIDTKVIEELENMVVAQGSYPTDWSYCKDPKGFYVVPRTELEDRLAELKLKGEKI